LDVFFFLPEEDDKEEVFMDVDAVAVLLFEVLLLFEVMLLLGCTG
jgi:hypothetical protein